MTEDNKAEDIISIDVKNKTSVTDNMIIVSGRSLLMIPSAHQFRAPQSSIGEQLLITKFSETKASIAQPSVVVLLA